MLKGSFEKSYKFQTIVTEDILRKIDTYLQSRGDRMAYRFETINGAKYEVENIEEIIGYDNPSDAKIDEIYLMAQKEGRYIPQNFITVKFINRGRWSSSASLYIRNANQDEISVIFNDMDRVIQKAKADYSWLYNKWVLISLNFILSELLFFFLYHYVAPLIKENNASWWIQLFLLQLSILIPFTMGLLKTLQWVYPETVFLIGDQKAVYEKLMRRRNWVLGTILTVILGVIASIIATKCFLN